MSKIEKTDSWASWAGRIKDFIIANKIFSGGAIMSFVASLLAPLESTFGILATILLITGLGSSIFLLLSLLWKEFIDVREIKKDEEKSSIELNRKREEKIDGILIEATNSSPDNQIRLYNQVIMLARDLPEVKKQRTEEISKRICGNNATQEQKSAIYTLLEKYEPFRDQVNKLLATKVTNAIKTNSISKQSVEFLSSITDQDLDILKKQFKYVLQLPHLDISQDLAIYNYDIDINNNLQSLLLKEKDLIHLESCFMKFYGNIWIGEGNRSSYYKIKNEQIINDIDSNNQWNLKITRKGENSNNQETQILFIAYICLNQIGMEIFNLLKNDLDPIPLEYLDNLILYLNKTYGGFTFEKIEKNKELTN